MESVFEPHIVDAMGDVAQHFDVSLTTVANNWQARGMPTVGSGPDRKYDLLAIGRWRRCRGTTNRDGLTLAELESLSEVEFDECLTRIQGYIADGRWLNVVYDALDHTAYADGVSVFMETILYPIATAIRKDSDLSVTLTGETAIVTDDGRVVWCELSEPFASALVQISNSPTASVLPIESCEHYGEQEYSPDVAPERQLNASWTLGDRSDRLPVTLQAVNDAGLTLRNQHWPDRQDSAIKRLKDYEFLGLRTVQERKKWRARVRREIKG